MLLEGLASIRPVTSATCRIGDMVAGGWFHRYVRDFYWINVLLGNLIHESEVLSRRLG
jgi:hypothetical protein